MSCNVCEICDNEIVLQCTVYVTDMFVNNQKKYKRT